MLQNNVDLIKQQHKNDYSHGCKGRKDCNC